MDGQDFKIEIVGIEPNTEVKNLLREFGERLRLQAPCDSCFRLAVAKTKRALRTSCRVISRTGTFVASASGDSPSKALRYLELRLIRRLNRWKRSRNFQNLVN